MTIDDIKTVAVVGAGDMGHGIAEVALLAGYKVKLYDIKDEFIERGRDRIIESLEKLASKGKVPTEHVEKIKSDLLSTTVDLSEACANADLVIEAVPEVMDLKKKVFTELDEFAPPNALLASNTSTMSITEIAAVTERPEQVLGLHFFNPAVLMRLVEVIRAEKTSDETIQTGLAFVEKAKKVPVLVRKDVPGFIANRVNAPASMLIANIVENGEVEPEPLDAFVRLLGSPMGPCELIDYVGVDVLIFASSYFAEAVHPDFAPPSHLVKMMEDGNLGKKTGQGYFDWSQGRPEIDLSKATDKFDPIAPICVQINEATKLIDMGVCSVNDVDVALVNSTGNPVGPMTMGRMFSRYDLADKLELLAAKYEKEIFKPTQRVIEGGYKF